MDLLNLDIFRTVAEERSVTRAAERLGRVQSNVTTRVQQLEEQLGSPLFLREGRRMVLTPAGHTLLGYADRLLTLAEEARQALKPDEASGRLRVGAMESTSITRLPVPLARVHADWPDLQLDLRTAPSRQLVEDVLEHRLDVALVAWPPPGLDVDDATMSYTPMYTESLLIALPATHPPVTAGAPLQVDTIAVFKRGCTYRQIGEDWMKQANGYAPHVLELGSYPAILACVAAGRCAGIVPQAMLDQMRSPPALRWVPIEDRVTMLVTREGYDTPAFNVFRKALQDDLCATPPPEGVPARAPELLTTEP